MLSSQEKSPIDLFIRKIMRWTPLSDDDVNVIESLPIVVRQLSAGQDIVREADKPSQACLVLEGWLCAYKIIEGGRRQIISLYLAGDTPDLQTLRMNMSDFSLGTLTNATVAFIPHESLRAITQRHASLAVAFWRQTLADAAIFREWITSLGRRPAPQRLAHLFCELHTRQIAIGHADQESCPLPITQTDLGDAMGITSVHVNRALRELRNRGLCVVKMRRMTVLDGPALWSFADFDPGYLQIGAREPS